MNNYASYKCRKCDAMVGSETMTALHKDKPYDWLTMVMRSGNGTVMAHDCADGSVGLCDLIGVTVKVLPEIIEPELKKSEPEPDIEKELANAFAKEEPKAPDVQ